MDKKWYWGVVALAFFAVFVNVFAAVPADTIRTTAGGVSTAVLDYVNVTGDYYWSHGGVVYNLTAEIAALAGANATNEWGLVYGTTGDWFNYTDITYTPVYINLHMHPLNETIAGEKLWPQVYDKDATHWQLALYWYNGTQYSGADVLVMYYAHVEWDNTDGLEYILPNDGEPA